MLCIHSGYQIKKDMGVPCSKHGRKERCVGNVTERDHLEDLGVDGRISKWICKNWDVVGAWAELI